MVGCVIQAPRTTMDIVAHAGPADGCTSRQVVGLDCSLGPGTPPKTQFPRRASLRSNTSTPVPIGPSHVRQCQFVHIFSGRLRSLRVAYFRCFPPSPSMRPLAHGALCVASCFVGHPRLVRARSVHSMFAPAVFVSPPSFCLFSAHLYPLEFP